MRVLRSVALTFSVLLIFMKCNSRENQSGVKIKEEMSNADSASKLVLQTFALPFSEQMKFDSNSLVFYCSRTYDTSSLIHMERKGNLLRGVYYKVLPEYHRFLTDYHDSVSKIIYFEGYSFNMDSVTWKSVTDQANTVFLDKPNLNKNEKYTDGATYALYYNGQSRHGNGNDEAAFVKFDSLLKVEFIWKYALLKKPFMHKKI